MKVIITLPEIQALSRNMTNGKYWDYSKQMDLASKWTKAYGRRVEYHFTGLVDVTILAYYDTRGRKNAADSPNIDDKIFTDVLNRYYLILTGTEVGPDGKKHRKMQTFERKPYFIEDDNPNFLRYVRKRSIASDHYEVKIVIEDATADDLDDLLRENVT